VGCVWVVWISLGTSLSAGRAVAAAQCSPQKIVSLRQSGRKRFSNFPFLRILPGDFQDPGR
jgi:hypothetical protein